MPSHSPESVTAASSDAALVSTDVPASADGFTPVRGVLIDPSIAVRAADLEPYIGLRYLSRLFRLIAVVLIVLLVSEVIAGLSADGYAAVTGLLAEASRLIVLAGLLWGTGDLAILLIDVGHDLRATRILIGRQLAYHVAEHHLVVDPTVAGPA